MRLDLIRHGPTDTSGLLLGRTDAAPAPAAFAQLAHQAAGRTWSAIVTSPLARASLPAERLARERATPLRTDDDWRELDFGDWDGTPVATLRADPAVAARLDVLYAEPDAPAPPNGESWRDLETRIRRALDRLFEEGEPESTLVATHGGPIRAALALACGLPFANTWGFRIDHGTRVSLHVERTSDRALWAEIVEIAQP